MPYLLLPSPNTSCPLQGVRPADAQYVTFFVFQYFLFVAFDFLLSFLLDFMRATTDWARSRISFDSMLMVELLLVFCN